MSVNSNGNIKGCILPKIAIIGSRGIPAMYGGFEVFAEKLSGWLVEHGFDVTVYSVYELSDIDTNIPIHRVFIRTTTIKCLSKIVLSIKSMLHASFVSKPDIILLLGVSGVPFLWLVRLMGIQVVFNPDGLEHKRTKWSWFGRFVLKTLEMFGVLFSHSVIADSRSIADYIQKTYGVTSTYIPYGADICDKTIDNDMRWCNIQSRFGLERHNYFMVVGRCAPENNFELIVKAYDAARKRCKLLIVSDVLPLGLVNCEGVVYSGPVYDREMLAILRMNASVYIHGHSVGGTNPSLLEAVASGNPVFAYDVSFNREVLGDLGHYFSCVSDLAVLMERYDSGDALFCRDHLLPCYAELLRETYSWDKVCSSYANIFTAN